MTQLIATATPPEPRRRWTTAEFRGLVDAGHLRDGSGTFLWDGEMIEPMPKKRPHINTERALLDILNGRFPNDRWTVDFDSPLELRDGFEPQPDIMVLRGPRASYIDHVPTPADVALLVEVSSTTYSFDSGEYLQGYARVGIAAYWIVNIKERRIEVYFDPDADRATYRTRQDYGPGMQVPLEGGQVAVDEVFRFTP